MRHILVIILLISGLFIIASAETITLNENINSFETVLATSSETELEINISTFQAKSADDGISLQLPEYFQVGSGYKTGPGKILLPSYTTMIAIPGDAVLSISVEKDEFTEIDNIKLAKASEDDETWMNAVTASTGFYPDELVEFEYAGKMRDIHLARLTVYPFQYDYNQQALKVHHTLTIKAVHTGGDILPPDNIISEAFYPIYDAILANNSMIGDVQLRRGGYWFIVHGDLISNIDSLADWKKAKGFDVKVINLADIGYSPSSSQIYNYIITEYNNTQIKPDYICLVGDVTISYATSTFNTYSFSNPYGFGTIDSDNYYTFLEGNDYFPELFIGRIAVDYVNELNTYIDKHSNYERYPYMVETDWYLQATMVAGSNYPSPRLTKLWCRELMMNHSYTDVDTFLNGYSSVNAINASINDGATFVNYRGYGMASGWSSPWYNTGNVYQLTNGPKYGVMTSIVCGTGDYNSSSTDQCLGEAWIRGVQKGGPGFIGTSNPDSHTKWNNAIDVGIYWGLFETGINTLAQSQLIGKMIMYYAFPEETYPNGRVNSYFHSYNDLGDPELNCWINIPKPILVTYNDSINTGNSGIEIGVTSNNDVPIKNAYVCIWKGDEIFLGGFTDIYGMKTFQVETLTPGTMTLTVTKPSYIPFETDIIVQNSNVSVGLNSFSIDDDNQGSSSGDGDLIANPGEIIELSTILRNTGSSQPALNVNGVLSTDDTCLTIISSSANYGDINPADSAIAVQPYVVSISNQLTDGFDAELILNISDSLGNSWQSFVFIPIAAANLDVNTVIIQSDNNNNGILDRGESAEIVFDLYNSGSKDMISANARLRTTDPMVQITDSTGYFDTLTVGSSSSNAADPFALTISGDLYNGHMINLQMEITGESGQTQLLEFEHMVGVISNTDPFGPDEYGYYCFDNTDTDYLYHPEYEWVNISSSWSSVSVVDDAITTRSLPFNVKHYGQTYNEFSLSDNGYITLGYSWWSNFLNTNIPSPQCAPAMIAPLWDDLSNGYSPVVIRYHHDEINNRFIVGWNNVRSNDTYQYYTFEIIILDAVAWPTPTGDNEIIFQYNSNTSLHSASVGICNQVRDIGMQYAFNNSYTPGAAPFSAGRAIKFTTGSEYLTHTIEPVSNVPDEFNLSQNYPNPFNASTIISYGLPVDCNVTLEVFDMLGRKVKTLVSSYQTAGSWSVDWNGKDDENQDVSAGIYLYRLQTGDQYSVKKMLLLK